MANISEKRNTLITRKEYMEDPSARHHEYYSQFVTAQTINFIKSELKTEDILSALINGDKNLNEITIPFNHMGNGGLWWWDLSPVNTKLIKECGECLSYSTKTCVGKAAAKIIAERDLKKRGMKSNNKTN